MVRFVFWFGFEFLLPLLLSGLGFAIRWFNHEPADQMLWTFLTRPENLLFSCLIALTGFSLFAREVVWTGRGRNDSYAALMFVFSILILIAGLSFYGLIDTMKPGTPLLESSVITSQSEDTSKVSGQSDVNPSVSHIQKDSSRVDLATHWTDRSLIVYGGSLVIALLYCAVAHLWCSIESTKRKTLEAQQSA